ncbi:hypothetical protein JYQ62_07810 [Nostoc sp. UHCC 0702]|nr:hypothetical protein JYQ62_07810 [Nostoc sp. UHCC 0702]
MKLLRLPIDFSCFDSLDEQLLAKQKLVPVWVVRFGEFIQPHRRLLRDLEHQ